MNLSITRQDIVNELAQFDRVIKPVSMFLKSTTVKMDAIRMHGMFVHEVPCDVNDVAYRIGFWTKIVYQNGVDFDMIVREGSAWGDFDTIEQAETASSCHVLFEIKE